MRRREDAEGDDEVSVFEEEEGRKAPRKSEGAWACRVVNCSREAASSGGNSICAS